VSSKKVLLASGHAEESVDALCGSHKNASILIGQVTPLAVEEFTETLNSPASSLN
jgi:hypothetical protein